MMKFPTLLSEVSHAHCFGAEGVTRSCHAGDTMSEDPDPPDGSNEPKTSAEGEVKVEADTGFDCGESLPSLNAFPSIQRLLASIDFSAIQAAQRAIDRTGKFKKIAEAQDEITESFARSLDFSRIVATHKALSAPGPQLRRKRRRSSGRTLSRLV